MAGMNSQLHISLNTEELNQLRREAEAIEISVSELIRRKLANPPTAEEFILFRKLKDLLSKNEVNDGKPKR